MSQSFPLRSERPWSWALRLIGAWDGRAQVELTDDGRLLARSGGRSVETELDNVCGYRITGRYHWWKAVGPRGSAVDKGFTFGTSARDGVCPRFREWVPTRYVRGGRMEALTVTADGPEALVAALEARNISGEDQRRR